MANYFKRNERKALWGLLLATVVTGVLGVYCWASQWLNAEKLLATSGLLATVSGVVQLEVSGLFAKITDHYCDDQKYPYGPPSYITQEIIHNPDAPVREWLRGLAYFNTATGFWLIVVGTGLQVLAVWI